MPLRISQVKFPVATSIVAAVLSIPSDVDYVTAQDSDKERQYVQLSVVGIFNAGRNTITAVGKPNNLATEFAVDFSRLPRQAGNVEVLDGKTVFLSGCLVQCAKEGGNGTPKCDRDRSRSGLFLQPLCIKEFRKRDGPVTEKDHSVAVVCRGRIHTDVVAIGGETTGFTIELNEDGDETWELDLPEKQRESAHRFNHQTVLISGTLSVRKGFAVRERWTVTVRNLVVE
ncbi:MAG: hypothetical protein HQ518_04675 [Rhodopirellula sp.]|nr:hypothetical protein [Rhodopirellula sp.]